MRAHTRFCFCAIPGIGQGPREESIVGCGLSPYCCCCCCCVVPVASIQRFCIKIAYVLSFYRPHVSKHCQQSCSTTSKSSADWPFCLPKPGFSRQRQPVEPGAWRSYSFKDVRSTANTCVDQTLGMVCERTLSDASQGILAFSVARVL